MFEDLFFGEHLRLCPWSLTSRGLSWASKFFCVLGLGLSSLVSSTPPLLSFTASSYSLIRELKTKKSVQAGNPLFSAISLEHTTPTYKPIVKKRSLLRVPTNFHGFGRMAIVSLFGQRKYGSLSILGLQHDYSNFPV